MPQKHTTNPGGLDWLKNEISIKEISKSELADILNTSERTVERLIQRGVVHPIPGRRPQAFDFVDTVRDVIADLRSQMTVEAAARDMGFEDRAALMQAALSSGA